MKKNFLNPTHKGLQPIRVLEHNVLYVFENTYQDFITELKTSISKNGLQPGLTYHCLEKEIRFSNKDFDNQTPFVGLDKKIVLHETFLSFLWTFCYTILVVFDEGIQKPLLAKTYNPKNPLPEIANEALKLFDYGLSLIDNFTKWDKNLPNPEEYDDSKSFYIERTNAVYLYAIDFILLHELGHVNLGHVDESLEAHKTGSYISSHQIKEDEYAADKYAINLLLKGRENPVYQKTIEFGLIAGFSSLIFLSSKLTSKTHPDGDERIKIGLESLNLDETDNLWGIACLSLKLWTDKKGVTIDLPASTETYKDLFYLTLKKLEDKK
ncbi:MAG: hypothetical protein JSU07_04985 [Bacteroidetes bacterium]|nr:hypothetical protein [Bacteroidota bacterium]